jgi:hypothetical protein
VNPAHRATVTYAEGRLKVEADNAGLNQVLREIARQTGMKIAGGVADERVYGTYGPASPADILGELLDGTGSNMLLRAGAAGSPAELILTPRGGGPTPPNPNAGAAEDDDLVSGAPVTAPHWVEPAAAPPAPASGTGGAGVGAMPPQGMDGASTAGAAAAGADAPSAGPDEPQSPNGVKTPQQIFQQLQQLQQQQQQSAPK